jgi:tetratricopeptide (TPR) repeat protein
MRLGPDLIYKCPQCGQLISRQRLFSGNTFGAKLYSDSNRITNMLPEFPQLTICHSCNKTLWLDRVEEVGEVNRWQRINNTSKSRFLTITEYFSALQLSDVNMSKEDECFIRMKIWHGFNDRIRERKTLIPENPQFENETEIKQWEDNCRQLLKLLEMNKTEGNRVVCAELHRNLGEFDKCIKILDSTEDENWIKDPMKYLAKMEIPFVVKLDTSINHRKMPYFQNRGELKEKSGDYQGALEDYDKAILLDDKNPIFYVLKAGACEKLGNLKIALENFNKALDINPNCPDVYINRSLFYRRQKQYELSQWDYEKAFSLEVLSINITGFNEEDVFKYGKLKSIVDSKMATIAPQFREGTLYVGVFLSPYNKKKTDTDLWIDAKKMPYFFFRKDKRKPIINKRFVKFEFFIAKCAFYIRVYVFKQKIRFINHAVLN